MLDVEVVRKSDGVADGCFGQGEFEDEFTDFEGDEAKERRRQLLVYIIVSPGLDPGAHGHPEGRLLFRWHGCCGLEITRVP
jgi:hypothetical protein